MTNDWLHAWRGLSHKRGAPYDIKSKIRRAAPGLICACLAVCTAIVGTASPTLGATRFGSYGIYHSGGSSLVLTAAHRRTFDRKPHFQKRNARSDQTAGKGPRADRPRHRHEPNSKPQHEHWGRSENPQHPKTDSNAPSTPACSGGRRVNATCRCPVRTISMPAQSGVACVQILRAWPRALEHAHVPRSGIAATPIAPDRVGNGSGSPASPAGRLVGQGSPVARNADLIDPDITPDEVLVITPPDASQSVETGVAKRFNLQVLERWPIPLIGKRCIRFKIPDGRQVHAVIDALRSETAISDPQPNFVYRQQGTAPERAADGVQYALAKLGLETAEATASGRGVVVGMIDTSVDTSHADLRRSDIVTYDATGDPIAAPQAHGTAIAGIIAGNGLTRGIAPSARLLSVRAFSAGSPARRGLATTLALLKSLDWSVSQRARVLNLSFAGPDDPLLRAAITATSARDIIIVAAAGNNGHSAPPAYPAAYPGVIAVTATDWDDRLYDKANVGPYVAIAAPGVDIFAPVPGQAYELQSGTSFAAAHVTGIIALLLERQPGLTAGAVRAALEKGAIDLGTPGADDEYGAGRANAKASLQFIAGANR
jgi:subtilisin family serine protease